MGTTRKRDLPNFSVKKSFVNLQKSKNLFLLNFATHLSINFSQLYLFRVEKYRETHWLPVHLNFGHVTNTDIIVFEILNWYKR